MAKVCREGKDIQIQKSASGHDLLKSSLTELKYKERGRG